MEQIPTKKISLQTDLKKYPTQIIESTKNEQITIGDLHANAVLMIHFLITYGVLELTEQDYLDLVDIYYQDATQEESEFEEFRSILARSKVNPQVGLVRFLGDMLADRGKNDYFILLLLEFLHTKNVNYEILFSNHDSEFILYVEAGIQPSIIPSTSFFNLKNLCSESIITESSIRKKYDKFYKSKLKLLSYAYNADEFVVFSHAPICSNTIKALAEKFKISYPKKITSQPILAKLIDGINKKFCSMTIFESYYEEVMSSPEPQNSSKEISLSCPVARTIWNRMINPETLSKTFAFNITFVHGHHSVSSEQELANGYIGLDGVLGKDNYYKVGALLTVKSQHALASSDKNINDVVEDVTNAADNTTNFKSSFEARIVRIEQHGQTLKNSSHYSEKGTTLLGLAQTFRENASKFFNSPQQKEDKEQLFEQCKNAYKAKKAILDERRFSKTAEQLLMWLAGTFTLWLAYLGKAIYNKKTLGKFSVFNDETRSTVLVKNVLKLESREVSTTSTKSP